MRGSFLTLALLSAAGAPGAVVAKTTPRAEVHTLPGWDGALPTKHYAGFVETDAPSGTHLYYYLVESATAPATDPLFVWMNGGPGASSLAGLFSENGPLLLVENNSLVENPYAWNRAANVLQVEFGPGIGYSYCANSTDAASLAFCPAAERAAGLCSPCLASDASVATQTRVVLETLLGDAALFPELAGRPLYLTGESYAGVYVPTLAAEILRSQNDTSLLNLSGIWVTDPCVDNDAQAGWLDLSVEFAWQKGLIGQDVYQTLSLPPGVPRSCVAGRTKAGDRVRITDSDACRHAWRSYDLATAGIGDAVHPGPIAGLPMYIDPLNAYGIVGGADLPAWLGSAAFRSAAQATQSPNGAPGGKFPYQIEVGNNGYPQYTNQHSACNDDATSGMPSIIDVYRGLADTSAAKHPAAANFREVMVLNGDIDPVIDMHGTEAAVHKIGWAVLPAQERRPWFFNVTASAEALMVGKPNAWGPALTAKAAGAQVGGFVTGFQPTASARVQAAKAATAEGGGAVDFSFRFVSVRNSGHMTPAYAPQKTLHTLYQGVVGRSALSPLIPTDWSSSNQTVFYGAADGTGAPGLFAQWVQTAMGSEYIGA